MAKAKAAQPGTATQSKQAARAARPAASSGGASGRRGPEKPASRLREELSLEAAIGRQVRTIRQSLGITITELARATSLSVGMLSKLENGQTSPSLTSLQSLATALNVPMTALFARFDESRDATFVRAGEGLPIERRGSRAGHLYQLLGNSMRGDVRVEPFLITLDEESSTYPVFEHPGYEFIYMLQGRVTYRYADRTYTLGPGDSLFFESDAPHGPADLTDLPAIYLSVIVTPRA
ncbi:MAG: XRE family transcriptional regulator [Sneathiellaceae bacterium]